jgi:hypothetical protein
MNVTKVMVTTIVVVVIVIFVGAGVIVHHVDAVKAASEYCVPAANEQCPSDQWRADYKEYKELKSEIEAKQKDPKFQSELRAFQEKQDLLIGLVARMNCKITGYECQVPQGYTYNEKTGKFELRPQTAASPAVNAPTPPAPGTPNPAGTGNVTQQAATPKK